MRTRLSILIFSGLALLLSDSCERLFDPGQDVFIAKEEYYKDWGEYRSAEMGLYSIQQKLVEQIVVLGELRGDLLEITENAGNDLTEVYEFRISRENKYASPLVFYELIGACNSLIVQLERAHPEVLDLEASENNYDRLYGEVLCMRAWAYFQAVRIYKRVPYVWQSLTTADEIEEYVNSSGEYIDSISIIYDPGGYYNDTLKNQPVKLEKMYLDLQAVVDTFTLQLETRVKVVGVIHNIENGDPTWDVTIWNNYARHFLLGQMYLTIGDYVQAMNHFENPFMYNRESETSFIRYGLDNKFYRTGWKNIFTGIDTYEHILTLWFGKAYQQQNELQKLFSVVPPNKYMLRPTRVAMDNWETMWKNPIYELDFNNPPLSKVISPGIPGDLYRGQGISYAYIRGTEPITELELKRILEYRRRGFISDYNVMISGLIPVVYKYTLEKNSYDQDANFILYRAAGAHLYVAEIYNRWEFDHAGVIRSELIQGVKIINDGKYANADPNQMGVLGRIGFGTGNNAIVIRDIMFRHDPYTNEIIGWYDYTNNLPAKQNYFEEIIMRERARELAFEGERFYDLMRVAIRRDDPSYLANKVAAKFTGAKAEQIRTLLMDESNWYVPYF
jgi:hypothetical protein